MRLRHLFIVAVASLMLVIGGGLSQAQRPIEITFALHTAPGGPEHEAVIYFKQLLEDRTNGRITVEIFPGGVLGGERDNIEQLTVGEVEMTQNGDLLASLIAPELAPTVVPFIFPSYEAVYEYWDGPYGDKLRQAIEDRAGIMVVGLHRRGARNLTTNKAVETPEDLAGLKLRVPEIETWVRAWQELGALVTPIAWTEVFSALQMGVVDGQENPLSLIYTTRLYEVQTHLQLTEHLPAIFHWALSKRFYDSLSPEDQQLILHAAAEAAEFGDRLTAETELEYLRLLEEEGMTIIRPNNSLFVERARPAIEHIAAEWADGVFEEVERLQTKYAN